MTCIKADIWIRPSIRAERQQAKDFQKEQALVINHKEFKVEGEVDLNIKQMHASFCFDLDHPYPDVVSEVEVSRHHANPSNPGTWNTSLKHSPYSKAIEVNLKGFDYHFAADLNTSLKTHHTDFFVKASDDAHTMTVELRRVSSIKPNPKKEAESSL